MGRRRISIRLVGSPGRNLSKRVLDQLNALDATCFPSDVPYPKEPGCYWWIAYNRDGEAVGFTGLKPLSGKNNGLGFLCRSGVLKDASGLGLQRRFTQIRIRKARALGLSEIITYTAPDNYRSAANLLRSGMRFYQPASAWGVPGALYFHLVL